MSVEHPLTVELPHNDSMIIMYNTSQNSLLVFLLFSVRRANKISQLKNIIIHYVVFVGGDLSFGHHELRPSVGAMLIHVL